jgi:hypothetical protein
MEERRLEATSEDMEAYFHHLAEAAEGVPAHCVDNMGEMGH